jgi:Ca-activated chloride channel family protein
MMRYVEWPWALALAPVLVVAVALLLRHAARRRAARLASLGDAPVVARLVPTSAMRGAGRRVLLLGGAALLAGLAFAGPRWGIERSIVRSSGVDVVLALDASLSMLATDERPTRLERMKREARRLVASSGGDRIGLIAFAGRSYILTPLTVDRGALGLFLDNLDPSVVGQAGSSLARTIRQGTELLKLSRSGADKALVIMSDGEAFESREEIVEAARAAAEAGVSVVAVGFGTTAGSTIPIATRQGATLKRDENGQVVVTRHDPEPLRAAAQAANGRFIEASATDKATRVRRALSGLRGVQRAADAGRDQKPRFQLFLLPALLLVLLDTLLAERRGRRRAAAAAATPASGAAGAAAALLVALALPAVAHAAGSEEAERLFRNKRFAEAAAEWQREISRGDTTAATYYNMGTALLAAGKSDEALAALERAAQSRTLDVRYRALFNLGYIHLQRARAAKDEEQAQQGFAAAAELYKRALRLRPAEVDAKWNYELANRKRPPQSGGGGGGGGSNEQQGEPTPEQNPQNRPAGGLDPSQAEELLRSAARDERDVQGRKQRQSQAERPPGGKDW